MPLSLSSYLPYAGGLSQPFTAPASDSQTHSCVDGVCLRVRMCVCVRAYKAESRQQSELLIFHAFISIRLQSVY